MNFTASGIIKRAFGVSNLVNTTIITQNDKVNSLNESYRDIYQLLLDSDDDYYLTEIVIQLTPAMVNPNSTGQYIEYNVPLPADVSRLRYVDYQGGTQWMPMDKYPISMKDLSPGNPMYRWRNDGLNIIGGGTGNNLSTIRVGYYPTSATLTLPEPDLAVGATLTLAQKTALVSPVFTDTYVTGGNINQAAGSLGRVVYYNGTSIVVEDEDLGTVTTLFTGAAITRVVYYQGWIFYLQSGSLYKFQSDLMSVGTPVLVVTPGTAPDRFSILTPSMVNTPANYNPPYLLWVSDGSTTMSIYTTAGVLVNTSATGYRSFFNYLGNFYAVTTAGALLRFDGTTFAAASGVTITGIPVLQFAHSDGLSIYATIPFTTEIHQLAVAAGVGSSNQVIRGDCNISTTFNVYNGKLTYQKIDQTYVCASLVVDSVISYPNNLAPEMIEFQCAIDFLAKQQADTTEVKDRFKALFKRYQDSVKRDDYQVERVKNDYSSQNARWFQ